MQSIMKWLHSGIYEERMRRLVDFIAPLLRPGDTLLDVGCGNGLLLRKLLDDPSCPKGVSGTGAERAPRGGEPVPVVGYDGKRLPFENRSFDVVIVADVLHHEEDSERLLRECARVSGRLLVIKDHARDGLLAQARLSLIDWAANAPYGVPCLYRYRSSHEWRDLFERLGLRLERELHPMRLYPSGWEAAFGGRLQYAAILSTEARSQS